MASKVKVVNADEVSPLPDTQLEEYALARKEKRQPRCIHCGKPLRVTQTQSTFIFWNWNAKKQRYVKDDNDGDAETAYCVECGETNDELIDSMWERDYGEAFIDY